MLTFQDSWAKFQAISGDPNATALIQAKQDINVGYHKINSAMARYFLRKQQFTDIVAGQQYYQQPVDSIRIMGMTTKLSNGREYPVRQMRSEYEWRALNTVKQTANWATYYFVLGNDLVGIFPIPSGDIAGGIRFYYEVQDVDLTQDDYTTGTVTVTQTGTTITGSGTSWTTSMIGRSIQIQDGSDGEFYEIMTVPTATSLTIKTPYLGPSESGVASYRIGQLFIFPGEFHDAPVDYSLSRYFEMKNNPQRAAYHLKRYQDASDDALQKYSSSSESSVITEQTEAINWWLVPPDPATGF